jgi:hypothetical protein
LIVKLSSRPRAWLPPTSAFTGSGFPTEAIVVTVRLYLRFNLSCRDVEEMLAERGDRGRSRQRVPVEDRNPGYTDT